jgi:hypothetical protein
MPTRRTTVITLGTLLAGSGAVLGTGAFDTVEAERSISLKTAPDSDALLGFEILDEDHVRQTDGTIDFDLVARSKTTFAELVNVRNNGTQTVTRLRFEFDVTVDDQPSEDIEDALHIVSGDATIDANRDTNLLGESNAGGADDDELSPGEAIPFGIKVDLTDDIHEITGDPEITLTIIADTGGESGTGDGKDDTGDVDEPASTPFQFTAGPSVPGSPGQSPSVEFTIENGGAPVSVTGFRVDWSRPGDPDPETFEEFSIEESPVEDGVITTGDEGYNVGEGEEVNVSHDTFVFGSVNIDYALNVFRDSDGDEINTNSALKSGIFDFYLLDDQKNEWAVED